MTMTAQEVFDTVASHLLRQNKQSISIYDEGSCRYRSSEGLMCAVGILLTDEEYKIDWEGVGSDELFDSIPSFNDRVGHTNIDIVRELQKLHDTYEPQFWKVKLALLAANYGLTFNPEN